MRKLFAFVLVSACLLIPAAAQQDKPLQAKPSATPAASPSPAPVAQPLRLRPEHTQELQLLQTQIQSLKNAQQAAQLAYENALQRMFLELGGSLKDYDSALNRIDNQGALGFLPKTVAEAPKAEGKK